MNRKEKVMGWFKRRREQKSPTLQEAIQEATTHSECACMEKLKEWAEWPFYRAVAPIPAPQDLAAILAGKPPWAVKLYRETADGQLEYIESVLLTFCPNCGARLRERELPIWLTAV